MNFHLSILHTCLLGNWISQQVTIHTADHHTKPSSHLPPPSPYSAFHSFVASFVCILVCIFGLRVCLKLLIQGERGCCEWALHHINMWVLPCRKPLSPLERSQPSAARPTSLKNTITGVNTNRKLCCYLSWSAWSLCFFSRLSARITFSFSPSLPPSFPLRLSPHLSSFYNDKRSYCRLPPGDRGGLTRATDTCLRGLMAVVGFGDITARQNKCAALLVLVLHLHKHANTHRFREGEGYMHEWTSIKKKATRGYMRT